MDRYHPELLKLQNIKTPKHKKYGCGKYLKQIIDKPKPIKNIPRLYGRYGLPIDVFCRQLALIPTPNAVLITSGMTYWYPGVFEAVRHIRRQFPKVPVVLGGTYASLCTQHARRYSGADLVIAGADLLHIIPAIMETAGASSAESNCWIPADINEFPYPAYHLLTQNSYICVLSSRGCPFSCSYCASKLLHPRFEQRRPELVVKEIEHFYRKLHIRNFAFYDDALLVNADKHIHYILDGIIGCKIKANFHTPNALHAKYITYQLADKMYKAGFKTIRLGLETIDPKRQKYSGGKVNLAEFQQAVTNLKQAGYNQRDIGAYILVGLPDVPIDEISETVKKTLFLGAKPILTEYSPIPGTRLWNEYKFRGDLSTDEPLLHNNSLVGYYPNVNQDVIELKYLVQKLYLELG